MASNNSSERENNDVPLEFRNVISVDTEEPQEQPNFFNPLPQRSRRRLLILRLAEMRHETSVLERWPRRITEAYLAERRHEISVLEHRLRGITEARLAERRRAISVLEHRLRGLTEARLAERRRAISVLERRPRNITEARLAERRHAIFVLELVLRGIAEEQHLAETRHEISVNQLAVRDRNQQLDSVRERNPLAEAPRGRVLRQIAQPDDSEEICIDEEARVYPAKEMGDETSIFKIVPQLCKNSSKIQDQCPTVKLIGLREKEGSATSKELSLARNINSFCYNAQSNSSKDSPTSPLVFKVFLTGRDDVNVPSVTVSEKSPLGCIESSWGKGSMSYDGRRFQPAEFITC